MKVTIKDVAKLSEVSVSTASKALNRKKWVSDETRDKVFKAAKELKYRPNKTAQDLIKGTSNTVGLIITDLSNPFFSSLLNIIQREFDQLNIDVLIKITNNNLEKEKRAIDFMINWGVAGILLVPTNERNPDIKHLEEVKYRQIPLIMLTNKYLNFESDCVMTNLPKAMYDLTRYLLDQGSEKILFLSECEGVHYVDERIKGYRKAYEERGLEWDKKWIIQTESADVLSGKQLTEELNLYDKADAIITINAHSALGVLSVIKNLNIKMPEELSLACFDEFEYNTILYQPLTYANQDLAGICQEAIKLLQARIDDSELEENQTILIDSSIIINDSTATDKCKSKF